MFAARDVSLLRGSGVKRSGNVLEQGRFAGLFFLLFTPGDQGCAGNDQENSSPTFNSYIFLQKKAGGKCGDDETKRGQRPDHTDILLGEKIEEPGEKNGFE